ncbi:hypothetical protein EV646_104292 [Kribbella antiqua]|uniref:Uncharacterized protein n=1 Tax=Kribbella antiqua TaxID=2512217 RepID=A0A4R2IUY7_9ACTN|nr:hypothetical protein EV646_104292 [Kribbella antiqua]
MLVDDEEDELVADDEDVVVEPLLEEESEEPEVDGESDLALTELLPVERLSFR